MTAWFLYIASATLFLLKQLQMKNLKIDALDKNKAKLLQILLSTKTKLPRYLKIFQKLIVMIKRNFKS